MRLDSAKPLRPRAPRSDWARRIRYREALLRQFHRGMHQFRPRLLAVLLVGVLQAAHRARYARRAITRHRILRGLARRVQVHIARRGERSAFAEVDKRGAPVRQANQHEAAAADIARARVGHRQRQSHGRRGVDRVAAVLQNLQARLRWRGVRGIPPCRGARAPAAPPTSVTKPRSAGELTCDAYTRFYYAALASRDARMGKPHGRVTL